MTTQDLRRAYVPDYFSIENILACQTLIPCQTQMRLPKFGFLVPDCNSEDLPVGTNLELPLWAARVLCRPCRAYISVSIPPGFKQAHREVIDEDATRVNLKEVHPQYFEAGHLCTSLFHNDAGELAEMLPEVLQQRIMCIGESTITSARNPWVQRIINTKSVSPDYMDILETSIYRDSKQGSTLIEKWLEPLRGEATTTTQYNMAQRQIPPTTMHSVSPIHNSMPSHPMGVGHPYNPNIPYNPPTFSPQTLPMGQMHHHPQQLVQPQQPLGHHNNAAAVQQQRYHQMPHPHHHMMQ